MTGNHFISAVVLFSYHSRSDNPSVLNTFHKVLHILIIKDTVWMIWEIVNFRKWDVKDFRQLILGSLFIVHKQLIESRHP